MKKIILIFLVLLFSLFTSCTGKKKNPQIVNSEFNQYLFKIYSEDNTNEDDRIIEEIEYDEHSYDYYYDKIHSSKKYFGLSGQYSGLSDRYVIDLNVYGLYFGIFENEKNILQKPIEKIYKNGNVITLSINDIPAPWGGDNIEYNILINQLDDGKIKLNTEYPYGIPTFHEFPEYPNRIAAIFNILENEIFIKNKSYNFSPTHMVIGYDIENIGGGISVIFTYENDTDLVYSNVKGQLDTGSLVELIEFGRNNGKIRFAKIKYLLYNDYMCGKNDFAEGWCNMRHLREF
jgi:hypothetical protein